MADVARVPFLTAEEVGKAIEEVLTTWPLYRVFTFQLKTKAAPSDLEPRLVGDVRTVSQTKDPLKPPSRIAQVCHHPKCGNKQNWRLTSGGYSGMKWVGFFHEAQYVCLNCEETATRYYLGWFLDKTTFAYTLFKAGQYPELDEQIASELRAALRENRADLEFYKKALRCRNHNYGLGSLVYLRRVVENRMNDVLDLIADLAAESGLAGEELQELDKAKSSYRFEDKVGYAGRILPSHLKPGGANPFTQLHSLASEGIHSLTEDECLAVFDKSRLVFEYLFQKLRIDKTSATRYAKGLQALTRKTPRTPKPDAKSTESSDDDLA